MLKLKRKNETKRRTEGMIFITNEFFAQLIVIKKYFRVAVYITAVQLPCGTLKINAKSRERGGKY